MILAGDVGGTKTVVALFEIESGGLRLVSDATFPSTAHASFEEILTRFLEDHSRPRIETACFGVAGPVVGGRVTATNLPWTLDEEALARTTGAGCTKLLNDLEAMAYGMLGLADDDRAILNRGAKTAPTANAAVISAGTGLGQALLVWDGKRHVPIASEGGHVDFAPRTDQEIELLGFLRQEFGDHVSYERLLSGPGLHNIYRFLRSAGHEVEPGWLAERMGTEDPSVVIGEVGLAGKDSLCAESLDLFASIYGAQAGNLVLTAMALGGLFIGGGIAPKLLPVLQRGGFMRAFTDKGRFSALLESVEVSVALNPRMPLLGAAGYAAQLSP